MKETSLRQSFIRIVALLSPLAVLVGTAAWFLRPEPWAPSAAVVRLDGLLAKAPFGTVVVGPSFARADVNPRVLAEELDVEPKRAVTLAFNSAGPATWYALLKYRVYAGGYAPALVVVVTTMDSLLAVSPSPNHLHDLTEQFAEPDATIRALTFSSRHAAWLERALQRRGAPRAAILRSFRDGPLALLGAGVVAGETREADEDDAADVGAVADAAGRAVFGEDHEAGSFQMVGGRAETGHEPLGLFGDGVEDPRQSYLPALAGLVHAHGGQLVIALPPTAARFRPAQYLPLAREQEIVALVGELGVGWVDLRDTHLPDEAFRDGRHMRPETAHTFTDDLSARLIAIGATRPGPIAPPIERLALSSVQRIGHGPGALGTVKERGPCAATVTLTGAAALGKANLANLPWRRGSPLEVREAGVALEPLGPGEALPEGCVGKFQAIGDRLEVRRRAAGPIEVGLAEAVPVKDGAGEEAWWLWPATSLRWSYPAPPTVVGTELAVAVEVRPVETPAAAPILHVGDQRLELSRSGDRFVGTLAIPRPTGPWAIEVENPEGAAWAEVHALSWQFGEQHQEEVVPRPTRWVDLAQGAPLGDTVAPTCRSCAARVWLHPGDTLTLTPSAAARRADGGLWLAQLRLKAATAEGADDGAPLAPAPLDVTMRLGDEAVLSTQVVLHAAQEEQLLPVRPPVVGRYNVPLVIELRNPAENPPVLFSLWGGAD